MNRVRRGTIRNESDLLRGEAFANGVELCEDVDGTGDGLVWDRSRTDHSESGSGAVAHACTAADVDGS